MTEIDDNAGEETRLGCAKQKSQEVKLIFCVNETHQDCDYSPRNHDAGNPTARRPFLDENASRYLQNKVAEEKNAGAETKNCVSEAKSALHLQICITDVC